MCYEGPRLDSQRVAVLGGEVASVRVKMAVLPSHQKAHFPLPRCQIGSRLSRVIWQIVVTVINASPSHF